jgi:hypothetical protein
LQKLPSKDHVDGHPDERSWVSQIVGKLTVVGHLPQRLPITYLWAAWASHQSMSLAQLRNFFFYLALA